MSQPSVSDPATTAISRLSRVGDVPEDPAPPASAAPAPYKRPPGAMRGVRSLPCLWVIKALKSGYFTSASAHTVAAIIADAVDADGRWCYLHVDTIVERSGGTVSVSTVKRALKELIAAGIVYKFSKSQRKRFFHDDLSSGKRYADRLPDVLELMIPAAAFPAEVLDEINEARYLLGENPLNQQDRPDPPRPGKHMTVGTVESKRAPKPRNPKHSREELGGVVYLVGAPGEKIAKIGTTTGLKSRLRNLQNSSPQPLKVLWATLGNRPLESWLHDRFAKQRLHGEWFYFDGDPISEVEAAMRDYTPPEPSLKPEY